MKYNKVEKKLHQRQNNLSRAWDNWEWNASSICWKNLKNIYKNFPNKKTWKLG